MRALLSFWKLTAIAVFSLSIAMALGVIALSISNTFLLMPPSAADPGRLVMMYSHTASEDVGQISYTDYQYLLQNNHVFTAIAAAPNSISVNEDGAIKVVSRAVSGNYLSVMGIQPYLGRLLTTDDEIRKTKAAVMTYSCWQRLGADPKTVGKVISSMTVVGILPKEFTGALYGVNGDLLVVYDDTGVQRDARHLILTARLKPGVTRRQAQAEMTTLASQLAAAYPKEDHDRTLVVTRATLLPPDGIPTAELVGGLLLGVVLLVLLIACANVANLLLAIAVGRRQESAIKLALGAPRSRLIREFLQESSLLCLASGAAGYAIAAAVIARYSHLDVTLPMVGSMSLALNLRLDGPVIAFSLGLILIAILATGLAPALYASSPALAQVLSGELVVGGTGKAVRRNILVIAQVAVCTLVLVGMGLCQRSLSNLRHVDPGFSERKLVALAVYPENATSTGTKPMYAEMKRKVAALGGVESVALASSLPLLGGSVETVLLPGGVKKARVAQSSVDEDFFSTFGIRVLSGRVFSSVDQEKSPAVVVINHKMGEMFWPGKDPLGQTVMIGDQPKKFMVVGVVADGRYDDLDEDQKPYFYFPLSQRNESGINVVARTKGDPELWVVPMAQALRMPGAVPLNPMTYENWLNLTLIAQRLTSACVAGLGALGLILAAIGLFGAISYSVSERRKEIGIRVALGARPGQLLRMILRHTLLVAGSGVMLGVLLGVGATIALRSQFYGIGAVEWTVLVPVGAAMLALSALVAYLSARPWVGMNPMEAVRHA